MSFFINLTTEDRKVSSSMKLAKLLANAMYVPVAVLADDTLDWTYKLTRLIQPKEFKQCSILLDILITNLQDHPALSQALQQACQLRGWWCNMANAQRKTLLGQQIKPYALAGTRSRILDDLTSMFNSVRD